MRKGGKEGLKGRKKREGGNEVRKERGEVGGKERGREGGMDVRM